MSQHGKDTDPRLIEGLTLHHLPHDKPSQLADAFRAGYVYAARSQVPASQAPDERKLGVHLSHCNFGEHAGTCAYGDDENCQALSESWSWFGKSLQRSEAAKAQTDEAFELGRQQGMEQERALWQLARDGQGMEAPSTTKAEPAPWEENARYLLGRCKHTIRAREGGGPESLLDSLILTFTKMESLLAATHAASPAPEVPSGAMFDAFGDPRTRYVRITLDGSHCIMRPSEGDNYIDEARQSGDESSYVQSDVYLSEREADDLPEFDGF